MKTDWYAAMIVYLLTIIYADNPEIDIHMEEKTGGINHTNWLYMICFSNTNTLGCSSEFLLNQKSYDQIRGEDNLCYHSVGLCSNQLCTCSNDCKQFTLNFTSLTDIPNKTFGCNLKVEVNKVTFKATIQLKLFEEGFKIIHKEVTKMNGSNLNQEKTTQTPDIYSFEKIYGPLLAIGIAFLCVVSLLSFIVKIYCKCQDRKEYKSQMEISSPSQRKQLNQSDTSSAISIISHESFRRIHLDQATSDNVSNPIFGSEFNILDKTGKIDQNYKGNRDAHSGITQGTSKYNRYDSKVLSGHQYFKTEGTTNKRSLTNIDEYSETRQGTTNRRYLSNIDEYSETRQDPISGTINKQYLQRFNACTRTQKGSSNESGFPISIALRDKTPAVGWHQNNHQTSEA